MQEFMPYIQSQINKLCPYCGMKGQADQSLDIPGDLYHAYRCTGTDRHLFLIAQQYEQEALELQDCLASHLCQGGHVGWCLLLEHEGEHICGQCASPFVVPGEQR